MAEVRINGRVYTGSRITIGNQGRVVVDGKEHTTEPQPQITVEVLSGTLQNLHVEHGDVTCGNVGHDVHAGGSVRASDVDGNVDAGGSVTCQNVAGDVNAGGSVTCGDVSGNVSAGGSIRHR